VQAFSYGGLAYALQFHMDVTHATMCRWTTRGHERMAQPNAKPRESHFEDRLMHDPACRAWLSEFVDHWLKPPAPAKAAKGYATKSQANSPKMSPPKPARANGSGGQRRAASRVSTR
jgi:GMP synthase (glutamine-hydrolysing)